MWSNGGDVGGNDESVLLLQPIPEKPRGKQRSRAGDRPRKEDPSSSHIGGHPSYRDPGDVPRPDVIGAAAAAPVSKGVDDVDQHSRNPVCASCLGEMHLILQIHAPLDECDRTLYVFGCNRARCHDHRRRRGASGGDGGGENDSDDGPPAVTTGKFRGCFGGAGGLRCFRSQRWFSPSVPSGSARSRTESAGDGKKEVPTTKLDVNDWGADDIDEDMGLWGDSEWGNDDEKNVPSSSGKSGEKEISMDDLEAMVAQCEMEGTQKRTNSGRDQPPQSSEEGNTRGSNDDKGARRSRLGPSFSRFELEVYDEPMATSKRTDDDEDDDVGVFSTSNADVSTVDKMLARYLEAEDDEEIVSALRGGGSSSGGGGGECGGGGGEGGGGEKYERLPPEERAFLAFSERLKRAPRQVVRYAYGGVPLWSIPLPPSNGNNTRNPKGRRPGRGGKGAKRKDERTTTAPFPIIPKCACGSDRRFEFQVLPSALHVLNVDDHAATVSDAGEISINAMMDSSAGGMNWGAIAVYSCINSCDASREEFLIAQESADGYPAKKRAAKSENTGAGDDMDFNDDGAS